MKIQKLAFRSRAKSASEGRSDRKVYHIINPTIEGQGRRARGRGGVLTTSHYSMQQSKWLGRLGSVRAALQFVCSLGAGKGEDIFGRLRDIFGRT